ncbi:helix-turn-helix transcriptional regulator [Brevibacillus centrosporus]|uniref:helix-turn-helix transcriptional regulator n=1 Tax=Brevibacillus centrosporus TaxID=54910 RepID=UPI000F0A5E43|nr:helix-turn-helix transcriptional regulator [Brevibacillus centrosporus]MEC2133487.1 helix-turn-helix transcriptional regulator [Brevibacillus centrosporus]RNB68556.1 XRE family transcriptional regulator [Brevibacillus centrosporus]
MYDKKPRHKFKELRLAKGKTQREVAIDIGVTETTIRYLENGYVNPSVELLFKLASYFETTVYDLWPDLAGEYCIV